MIQSITFCRSWLCVMVVSWVRVSKVSKWLVGTIRRRLEIALAVTVAFGAADDAFGFGTDDDALLMEICEAGEVSVF